MLHFFDQFYAKTDYMAHGYCLIWDKTLLWLHAGSDIVTGFAYYLIAAILFYFILKRRDVPFFWVFLLFGAFILSCGTTHFMSAWTIYYPSYWTEGYIKTLNAAVSLSTAIVLIPLMPKLLSLPSLKSALDDVAQLNVDLKQKVESLEDEARKRRKAEEELRMAKFSVDHTAVGIFWIKEDASLIYVNDHACKALGYPYAELIAKRITDIDPDFPPERWPAHWEALKQQGTFTFVTKHQKKDGTIIPVEVTVNYLEYDGIGYNFAYATDISKRLQAEEEKWQLEAQLRQAHKMEAIGTLAGGIAHDFNNLLAAILGYANLAKTAIPDDNPAKNKIEELLKAANRAKDLVKQILSFSHKRGQEKLPVDVCHIVSDSLTLLRASIPTSVRINENIDANCGLVMADPTQTHQILMNLCTNAFQAMEEDGGVLTVSARAVELTADDLKNRPNLRQGGYIQLTVQDTGAGIDPENLDKIFDPYFTTKGVGKGSGMGLAVVAGIVRSHDGIIEVDSKLGRGTIFNVYLPQTNGQGLQPPEEIADFPTGNERILLVDDEVSVADVTRQRVEQLGYRVTAKTSSEEALELFRIQAENFDLVITDQTMPELTGDKFSRELLKIRPDMPIIICTGYSSKMNAARAKSIGIRAFIMKPVDMFELAVTIRNVLDDRNYQALS